MIQVSVTGLREWRMGLSVSQRDIEQRVIMPAFWALGRKLTGSISEEFSGELAYTGETARQRNANLRVRRNALEILEPSDQAGKLRVGQPGWYTGTFGQALKEGVLPGDVIRWAQKKLGLSRRTGQWIAYRIIRDGLAYSDKSPVRQKYPAGQPRFEYHKYVVEDKNRGDVDKMYKELELGIPTLIHKMGGIR